MSVGSGKTIGIYWSQESWGGVDTHLTQLLKDWPDRNDQLIVFFNHNNQGFPRVFNQVKDIPNVKFAKYPSRSYTTFVNTFAKTPFYLLVRFACYFTLPFFYFIQMWQAEKLFRHYKLDVLISDNGGYPAAWGCLAAIQAAAKVGIKNRILLVHHCGTAPSKLRGWFDCWVDRQMAKTVTKLVAVSKATYQSVIALRDSSLKSIPFEIIYNGVDIRGAVKADRNGWPLSAKLHQPIWLGIVGRVEEYKGHEDLFRGLALLSPDERARVGIVVVGRGDAQVVANLGGVIESLGLKDNVLWTGFIDVTPQDLMAYFDAVVVMTRDFEGFGLTLAEAMAIGRPVIATKVGAIPEFIEHEKVGLLIEPHNPAAVADAIRDLLKNPEIWKKRGEEALRRIENFSGKKMAEAFYRLTRAG